MRDIDNEKQINKQDGIVNKTFVEMLDKLGYDIQIAYVRKEKIDKSKFEEVFTMAKKENRFEIIFKDGSQLQDEGFRQIMVDKETGVHYLAWKSGYGAGITPLLDSEGKPIIIKND